jgi:hypothetical protein
MTDIDLNSLPFDSEGKASTTYNADPASPQEQNPFSKLSKSARTEKPIYIRYTNYYTLAQGSAELPEHPIRTALNNDRPLVIYYVTDEGKVWATRLDSISEIKHACIGKRFMPHFPNAPAWARLENPDGFNMVVMRLEIDQFVPIEVFPDEQVQLTLYRKTKHLTNN